ncbi:acetyl-CoA carboxylase biotin carboxyl carrier protein [bacterium]|nr:MAG: acetyl-CoA carboxylase biotin carboxyl carrier protein [bacterium]
MNHDQVVEQLLELMKESDLDELRVRFGETSFELVRREAVPVAPVAFAAPQAAVSAGAVPAGATPAGSQGGGQPAVSNTPPEGTHVVKAPLVGVFYSAPSPGAEPFVQEGARVQPGQVLCILEAMKMMNEITAESAGTVTKIGPRNGELVKVDEVLFWIAP